MRSDAFFARFLGLIGLLAAGCSPLPPAPQVVPEPQVERPVVTPERSDEEMLKAMGLLKDGNLRQAEANLEEIVKVRPDIPEAYFNLGWVKHQLNKHVDAIAQLELGLKLRPDEIRARNLIALSYREMGKFADAETAYLKALEIAPDNDKTHLNLGILYELYLSRPQLALDHYRVFQKLQPWPEKKVAGWIAVLERKEVK